MRLPKISIVTPNYNQGLYLESAMQSILSQNYPNLEYIVIDGSSQDQSVEIIKKHEQQLSYWVSEPDKGMYYAIQKGFDQSTGEIMGWINSDDMLHPNGLKVVGEIFARFPEVEWIQGRPSSFDEQGRTIDIYPLKSWSKYHFYTGHFKWIQQESTFWRRSLWNKAGGAFNLHLKYAGDFDLWLRFFRYAQLYSVNALIGGFRHRKGGQISETFHIEYAQEAHQQLKKELSLLPVMVKRKTFYSSILLHLNTFIQRLKIFNLYSFQKKIVNPLLGTPPFILFEKEKQLFKIGP